MQPAVALIICIIVVIVAALAIYLALTIRSLFRIAAGLDRTLVGVGEIASKTAPVNGVLDAINATLVAGRNLLEGLFLKKAGGDAAGIVESAFPGEGARFLNRVGMRGPVVEVGETYPRGEAILNSLLGADPAPPAPAPAASQPRGPSVGGGGRISLRRPSPPPPADETPSAPGRLSAKGSRPWER